MRLSISLEKLWSWDKCSKRIFYTCFSLFLELFFSFSRFVRVVERNMRLRRDFSFSLQVSRVYIFSIFPSFLPSFPTTSHHLLLSLRSLPRRDSHALSLLFRNSGKQYQN